MSSVTSEVPQAAVDLRALSGERYRPLLNASPDGIAITDLMGRVLMASPVAARMLRATDASVLVGRPVLSFVVPEDRERAAARLALMFTGPRSGPSDYKGLRLDGTTFAIDTNAEFIRDADGNPTQILLLVRDITERKRTEEALRQSEERYRSILAASPDEITVTDLEGRIVMLSPVARKLFGFADEAEAIGRPLSDFVVPEDRERAAANIARMFRGDFPGPEEYGALRTDQTRVDIEVNGEFIRDAAEQPTQILFVVRDITRRKQIEGDLKASEARRKALLETAMDGYWLLDEAGRLMEVNEAYCRMSGYTATELRAMTIPDLDIDAVGAAAHLEKVLEAGQDRFEARHRRKDGSVYDLEISAQVHPGGRVAVFLRDITESKQAEQALRRSEERYRSILNASPDGIAITDLKGNILMGSPAAHAIFGFDEAADLVGRHISSFIVPEDRARATENLRSMSYEDPGEPREYRGLRGDGSTVDVEINGQFVPDAFGRPEQIVFVVRDIANRKQAEMQLRRKDELHGAILNAAMDGYWLVDTQGRILEANMAYCRMSGYTVAELQKMTLADIEGAMEPAEIARRMALIIDAGGARFESRHRRKDGSTWDVEVSVHYQPDDGGRLPSFLRDITERKRAEAATTAALQEKVALLKEIHHRVKNNLQIITSLLRLESSRTDIPGTRQTLKEMQSRVLAMALLHETLYRTGDFGHVDLGAYIEKLARQFFRAQGAFAGAIRLDLALSGVSVTLDQAIPCGLIVNELLTNAAKHAFPEGSEGTVRIRLSEEAGGEIRMEVSDDGRGLPPDFESRRARSLGLQLVSDLARQLRGRFDIGVGSTFAVRFRRSESASS